MDFMVRHVLRKLLNAKNKLDVRNENGLILLPKVHIISVLL